jgi:hypothetical protein
MVERGAGRECVFKLNQIWAHLSRRAQPMTHLVLEGA